MVLNKKERDEIRKRLDQYDVPLVLSVDVHDLLGTCDELEAALLASRNLEQHWFEKVQELERENIKLRSELRHVGVIPLQPGQPQFEMPPHRVKGETDAK